MNKEMSPSMLAALDEERQFQEAHNKNKVRRVKIEKVNQAWLVRFLPVGLGERNLWFVRLGQHWMNKQPIFCPKCVSQDFGGDPNAECPVCEMAELLNAEDNEAVSNYGFRLKANLTYLTYCLVYQIDPGRGETQEMPEGEVLKPWEFQHYKSSFDELMDYFRRGTTASRPFSVLDLEKGNDFWATRTTKGIRLDRQDPGPILDLADPNYEQKIDQIWSTITQPRIKLPTAKELETFARKAEAAAGGDDSERPGRSGRGGRDTDESDEPVDRPSRRVSRAPGRRMAAPEETPEEAPAGEAAGEPAAEDQIPGAEVPARAPTRPVSRPVAAPARQAAAPANRPASAAARPIGARPAAAPANRPASAAAARPATRPAAASSAASTVDPETEDPGIAEEVTDAAPPAEQPPEEGQEEAPPTPAARQTHATPPAANAGLRQRLINRVKTA